MAPPKKGAIFFILHQISQKKNTHAIQYRKFFGIEMKNNESFNLNNFKVTAINSYTKADVKNYYENKKLKILIERHETRTKTADVDFVNKKTKKYIHSKKVWYTGFLCLRGNKVAYIELLDEEVNLFAERFTQQ